MAITLRSGKELEEPSVGEVPKKGVTKENEVAMERLKNGKEKEKEKMEKEEPSTSHKDEVKPYVLPIPFPQRLKKPNVPSILFPQRLKDHTKGKEFEKFLEMFKKLELNIPILEAIA